MIKFNSFFLRVQLLITSGIILAILIITLSWSYFYYSKTTAELQTQGITLTSNLSQNVEPFIIDFNKDQLNYFLSIMLENPLVLFTGVINNHLMQPKIEVLQKQSNLDLRFVSGIIQNTDYSQLIKSEAAVTIKLENNLVFCLAPIFSKYLFPDDEASLLYNIPKSTGIIGYSFLAYQLPVSRIFSIPIKGVIGFFIFIALLFGVAIGKIISKRLTKRLQEIYKAINDYSFGDQLELDTSVNDEITEMSYAINGLISLVNIHMNKIESINTKMKEQISNQKNYLEGLNKDLFDFNLSQRVIIAHSAQELRSLIELLKNQDVDIDLIGLIANHANDYLNQIITFLQSNRKSWQLTFVEKINIANELSVFKPFFEFAAKQRCNQFIMTIDKNIEFETNRVFLFQSIFQLILNASKYTESGKIELLVTQNESNIEICVSDTGVGISQNVINKTFEYLRTDSFKEVDAFSTLGLGLVNIFQFSKLVKGDLQCNSKKQEGTKITLVHPKKIDQISLIKKVVILSKDYIAVKRIQKIIQKAPIWQCDVLPEMSKELVRLVLIDLDNFENALTVVADIKAHQPNCEFIFLSNNKHINASIIINKNTKELMPYLTPFNKEGNKNILIQGLTEDLNLAMKSIFENGEILNQYSYNKEISLRVVSEEFYKINTEEPLILIVESIKSLKKLIEQKGRPIDQLFNYNLFRF